MEMVEILQEFPRRDRDAKRAGAAQKSALMDLVDTGLPETFSWFFKAVSVKLSKTSYVGRRSHAADSCRISLIQDYIF